MVEVAGRVGGLLEWGIATSTLPGQRESGDMSLVRPIARGVLLAVVDGLGHGAEAAESARVAVSTIEKYAHEPLPSLIQRCHDALLGMRGVVMSLAYIDSVAHHMTWTGVGNVEGLLLAASPDPPVRAQRSTLITRGGILGSTLPPVRATVVPVAQGDLLIFTTDGVNTVFTDHLPHDTRASPGALAESLLARLNKGTDDALVLVARYLGGGATP